MIWLTEEDRRLLAEMEAEISRACMGELGRFMKPPIHFGSKEGGSSCSRDRG